MRVQHLAMVQVQDLAWVASGLFRAGKMPVGGAGTGASLDHSATWNGVFPGAKCDWNDPFALSILAAGKQQNLHCVGLGRTVNYYSIAFRR